MDAQAFAVVLPYPNTFLQLYQNWHDGVGGLPALSALEEEYGAGWRARGTRGNAFYQRARAIKNLVTTFMPDLAAVANVQRTFYEHHKRRALPRRRSTSPTSTR